MSEEESQHQLLREKQNKTKQKKQAHRQRQKTALPVDSWQPLISMLYSL